MRCEQAAMAQRSPGGLMADQGCVSALKVLAPSEGGIKKGRIREICFKTWQTSAEGQLDWSSVLSPLHKGLCCGMLWHFSLELPASFHYCLDFVTLLFSERERSLLSDVAAKCILRWTKHRSLFFPHHIPYIIVWRAGFIWFALWFFPQA